MRGFSAAQRSAAIAGLAVFFAVAGLLAGPAAQGQAKQQSDKPKSFPTGINLLTSDPPETEAKRTKGAGASFALYWVRWNLIAPNEKPSAWDPTSPSDPSYDWAAVDQYAISASAAGLKPVFQVYGAPDWANRCKAPTDGSVVGGAPCDPDPAAMAEFLKAAARRYSGTFQGLPKVRYWQVQNEPNLNSFFNPQFGAGGNALSPKVYRRILNVGYRAIKGVDSSNVVLSAGLAPLGGEGAAVKPMAFARELLCMNKRNRPKPSPNSCDEGVKLDVFDMHTYTTGGPTHESYDPENIQMGDLTKLARLLKAADKAGHIDGDKSRTPLWITEMSWDSSPPDPGGLPMKTLKRWTAEAMYRAWNAGVKVFFWFGLVDDPKGPSTWSSSIQSGLYFKGETVDQDRPKPSLQAFRFPFVAFSHEWGASIWGRTPSSKPGKVSIQVRTKSGWRRLAVKQANPRGLFKGRIRSRAVSRKRGSVRAVFRGKASPAFSLKPVADFYQPPFG